MRRRQRFRTCRGNCRIERYLYAACTSPEWGRRAHLVDILHEIPRQVRQPPLTGGAGSKLRKYTIGPYGKVTLHQARIAAQKVFSAKLEGRDPAREKREARIREVTDRVGDVLEAYIAQHVSANRSAAEVSRLLRREVGGAWGHKSIHDISKRDVVELASSYGSARSPCCRQ